MADYRLLPFIALVLPWIAGCQGDSGSSAPAPSIPDAAPDPLVNRVWLRTDAADLPGSKLIFLSDGTLVQDSCWETYRLSKWRRTEANRLVWTEDTMEIQADVESVDDKNLVLKFILKSDVEVHSYGPAPVPYLCPDMKRE